MPSSPRQHHAPPRQHGQNFPACRALAKAAARERLDDAAVLLAQNRFTGAVYLAGYAIECCLKHAICVRSGSTYLPSDNEVHSWDQLTKAAKLLPFPEKLESVEALYDSRQRRGGDSVGGPTCAIGPGSSRRRKQQNFTKEITALYRAIVEFIQ